MAAEVCGGACAGCCLACAVESVRAVHEDVGRGVGRHLALALPPEVVDLLRLRRLPAALAWDLRGGGIFHSGWELRRSSGEARPTRDACL
jgi:hypothetical protein